MSLPDILAATAALALLLGASVGLGLPVVLSVCWITGIILAAVLNSVDGGPS